MYGILFLCVENIGNCEIVKEFNAVGLDIGAFYVVVWVYFSGVLLLGLKKFIMIIAGVLAGV